MNRSQKLLKDMVVVSISNENVIEEQTIDGRIDEVKILPLFNDLTSDDIDEVRAIIKSEFAIKLDKGYLIEEKGHEKWFLNKKPFLDMKYWERYRKYLLADKGFSSRVVNTMDDVLDTLTDLLGDPTRDISYKRRGLIIGDVQSGKTANYTGLICKAVDSGYKVIVLLTGTIERLRQQTQKRIDEGFVGADSDAIMKTEKEKPIIGVGKYDSSIRPMVLTSTTDDFKAQNANNLGFDLRNINGPVIFVIKKNSAILKRLNKWMNKFNSTGEVIDNSILVIDDESDNASINTKDEDKPTAINSQIRILLKNFSKSSYVGFTATPFANIFIDPDSYNSMVEEDLFPKDYIYSLNSPSNYIGARNIFSEYGESANMLMPIDTDPYNLNSIENVLPLKHKSNIRIDYLPDDMKEAVATFLLANVIEDLRGMKNNHRSMLINVSRFSAVQEDLSDLVNDYLKNIQNSCKLYALVDTEKALMDDNIRFLYETYEKVYPTIEFSWNTIQNSLYKSCAQVFVQTINQRNGKNLRFESYKEGLRIIAVGGMSLSRGLTLEGLIVSYFYRNSKMYDTLMQMGRWFGYRTGYEDLCKIWMSRESINWYSHISDATDELREEVKRYEDTGLTPMDFGLRVRSDITSLLVTARNKMKSAESRECVISLSGVCIETPELYSDVKKNLELYNSVKSFISILTENNFKIEKYKIKNSVKYGFKNVSKGYILDFLEQLDVSPKNEQFNISTILQFIKDYKGTELDNWDIGFAAGESDKLVDLGNGIQYRCPLRGYSIENDGKIIRVGGANRRLGTSADGAFGLDREYYDTLKERIKNKKKHLSQKDYFINVDRNPLLTIYLIDLGKCQNKNMDAEYTKINEQCRNNIMVGFGIGIPTLSNNETKYARYILNKIAIQQIFEGDIDDWEFDEGIDLD